MVKYRRLNSEELIALKEEFVKFLSAQSISAPDWEKLKQTNNERVNELLDFFSDIVLEKVFTKIDYLEVISENEIKLFHLQENKARLVGLKFNKEGIDLNKSDQFEIIFKDISKLMSFKPEIYHLEKEYAKTRAEEAHFLISIGATISNKTFYEQISGLYQS